MFPITTNLKPITTPWATYAIIGTNVIIHFIITWNANLVIPSDIARTLGFVPTLFGNLSTSHRLVTCMFLHGDLIHLSGNMVFLLVFGRLVESEFGAGKFLAFYLTAGVTARLSHAIVESESTKPLIGASGAISGVLGAFLIANPRARITLVLDPTLIYFLRRLTVRLPAWIFLSMWFFPQISIGLKSHGPNVAYWAHVGGFVAGATMGIAVSRYFPRQEAVKKPHWHN
jgi:membrane associated rhomboid family serine protease